MGVGGAIAAPVTAYQYDWNMLPIGQALWLKELQSYIPFPPLQDPASYNLDQVMSPRKLSVAPWRLVGLGVHGRMTGDCGNERLLVEPVQEGLAARHARRRPRDIAEERNFSESIPAAERCEGGPLSLNADRAHAMT